jgi:hypothetical protein
MQSQGNRDERTRKPPTTIATNHAKETLAVAANSRQAPSTMPGLTATSSSPAGHNPSLDRRSSQDGQATRRGALTQLDRHRYLALCALVFALMLSHTLNAQWGGDFWEHAAAVRELAQAPFDPSHPLFALDAAHLDFAPYPLALGLFAKITGVSAVSTLEIAGMVNLVLLLIGFRLFVRVFSERRTAPFYALVFLLLLYGWSPWSASGLLHLNALGGVLSYPSTFAIAVGFFTVALFARWLRSGGSAWWLVAVALMATAAVLTHPVSAVFIYPTLAALVLESRRAGTLEVLAPSALTIAASIALALVWPYFSLVTLFTDNVGVYDATNQFIYEAALKRALPVLLAVPLIWIRLRRDWRDPLALLIVFFGLLYIYGDASDNWNWGRTISFEFIVVFTLFGDFASDLESRMRAGGLGRGLRFALTGLAAMLLVLELVNMRTGISEAVPGASYEDDPGTSRFPAYAALFRGTDRDAVTLAGLQSGRGIPVYAGKIVAYNNPEAFVDDHPQRQEDVRRFFRSSATQRSRQSIIDRYDVSFVLIDRRGPPGSSLPLAALQRLGSVKRSENGLILIRVRR